MKRAARPLRPATSRWRPSAGPMRRCQAAAVGVGGAGSVPATVPERTAFGAQTLQEGELVILLVRPSTWYFAGLSVLATIIAVIAAVVLGALGFLDQYAGPLLLIWTGMVCWRLADWRTRWYILTDRRVLAVRGLVRTSMSEVMLTAVSKVRAVRSPWLGLLGVGTVETFASRDAGGGAQVVWTSVRGPVALRDRIVEIVQRYGRRDAEVG